MGIYQIELNADAVFEHCQRVDEAERQFAIIAPKLTWEKLMQLEPRLRGLWQEAQHCDRFCGDRFCGMEAWPALKPRLVEIVGHCRSDFHPVLGTAAAYEIAYDRLLEAVPPCRGCSCGD
jgi:hypothetical protein